MRPVSSWGRLSADPHEVVRLQDPKHVGAQLANSPRGIAYGNGRSYGDVCLNPVGVLWHTGGLDHFVSFDLNSGRLVCEAGVLLKDIQQMAIPHGWILPVTPGTQLITVGGAIANDVHGKNHHVLGTFGDHVNWLQLLRTDREIIKCGPQQQPDWFHATVGGLGLTGVILFAEIQLRRVAGPWLDTETVPYGNLVEFFDLAATSEAGWEHTVSWIDCVNGQSERGLFMRANPSSARSQAEPDERKTAVPFVPPISLVNSLTLRPFNMAYFNLKSLQASRTIAHYRSFFYPLDNLLDWNRMYGPRGFYQYQSVVPSQFGHDATQAMLREILRAGEGSFLAVLKTFGKSKPLGMLSFPMDGTTLALDFPNNGEHTHKLFEKLDGIVLEAGGRIYPAKDARMPRAMFEAGYPRLDEFAKYRDPGISSALSRRLMGS
jgi:FAD/FMN-containing dehydrogenase